MTSAYEVYDPPSYPEDRFFTEAEIAEKQRATSLIRALSPGVRVCIMDTYALPMGTEQNPNSHLHTYDEYMNYRHNNIDPRTGEIVGDGDAWTNWFTYDAWAEIAPPLPPPPPYPNPPVGWNRRIGVNPGGISVMNGSSGGWLGYTFVTKTPQITQSAYVPGGASTRVTLVGQYQTIEAYVSPCKQDWQIDGPDDFHRLTVNAQSVFTVNGITICDPLPYGIDGSNGFLVTAHVSAAPAILSHREPETGWAARYRPTGNWTRDLDKGTADWIPATQDSLSLLMIEGYYSP